MPLLETLAGQFALKQLISFAETMAKKELKEVAKAYITKAAMQRCWDELAWQPATSKFRFVQVVLWAGLKELIPGAGQHEKLLVRLVATDAFIREQAALLPTGEGDAEIKAILKAGLERIRSGAIVKDLKRRLKKIV